MKHAKPIPKTPWRVVAAAVIVGGLMIVTHSSDSTSTNSDNVSSDWPISAAQGTTTTTEAPYVGWVNPKSSGAMWSTKVPGVLTFRGNPTRSYYGMGPVPTAPKVLWMYPQNGSMCGKSTDGSGTRTWCGTGWTGQPNVYETNGKTIVSFGAYDYAVHWIDYLTGADIISPFKTGDIIKGTVTTDPDGFPLTYSGSRDNYLHIIATDRGPAPVEIWKLWAYDGVQKVWNDDWDSSPLIIDDYMFEGGENSWFYIIKLNRGYDAAGKVTVSPRVVFKTPSWDAELQALISDRQFSIENSVAITGNTVYFANSAGLIQGWDISTLKSGGTPTRTFRFWAGDDTDASVVADKDGFLYIGSEYERRNARSTEVGQLVKLDPSKPDNPIVWSVKDQAAGKQGIWATPAIANGIVYYATNSGRVLGIDQITGEVLWQKNLGSQTWGSPVVVDNTLIEGDCHGNLNAYDVSNPRIDPPLKWTVKLTGCIESTPTVWKGRIFVGTRGGQLYAIGDR